MGQTERKRAPVPSEPVSGSRKRHPTEAQKTGQKVEEEEAKLSSDPASVSAKLSMRCWSSRRRTTESRGGCASAPPNARARRWELEWVSLERWRARLRRFQLRVPPPRRLWRVAVGWGGRGEFQRLGRSACREPGNEPDLACAIEECAPVVWREMKSSQLGKGKVWPGLGGRILAAARGEAAGMGRSGPK